MLTGVDLVLLGVGTVIGSGIFLVPSIVLRAAGTLGVAWVVWVVAGVLSLLGALTYGELGALKPEAGGLYIYIRDAYGPFIAFLYGWGLFFVIGAGSVATLMVAFTEYLHELVPITPTSGRIVIVVIVTLLAVVNVCGARISADAQNWMTGVKVVAIVALSLAFLVRGGGLVAAGGGPWWPSHAGPSVVTGIGAAMVAVLWAFEGWQYVTFAAGETANPQRTFPRALAWGTAAVVGVYLLANVGYVAALGPAGVRQADRVASESALTVFGPWAAKAVTIAILVSIVSAANGLTLTASRVYFAMARDGLFFERLARVHERFRTPAFAIAVSSAWACVLALTGTFEQLLTYVVFSAWIFYALGAAAVFHYRRAEPAAPRVFRVPAYPLTPIVFVLSALFVVGNTLITQPQRAAVGLGIMLVGTPAYFVWRRRSRRDASGGVL
jgi:APA family basic amino acid/polyamine antiporter